MDGQGLKTYGFYPIVSLRVQSVGILFGVDGEGKKGAAVTVHIVWPRGATSCPRSEA